MDYWANASANNKLFNNPFWDFSNGGKSKKRKKTRLPGAVPQLMF